jgi:hypothetical protein
MLARTETSEKVREDRLRRMAARQGLRLAKSRVRDPHAMGHGLYALIDDQTGGTISPTLAERWIHSWSLDQVERHLTGNR